MSEREEMAAAATTTSNAKKEKDESRKLNLPPSERASKRGPKMRGWRER